jgi:hypothetical protein
VHLLVADAHDATREAILKVTGDPAERARLGEAGRSRVMSHHSWPGAMKRLDRIVERAVNAAATHSVVAAAA